MDKKKLKIAVQMYGHLRTFEKCAPMLKRYLLDVHDCDVFMHTWDRLEHSLRSWYDSDVRADPLAVTEETVDKIKAFYAPKKLSIETQNFIDIKGNFGTHPSIQISLAGMKYMLYGQYTVNNLRLDYEQETGARYDYVVVVRPDIMPLAEIDFSHYEKEFAFYDRVTIHFVHNSVIKLREDKFFNYPLVFDCFYFSKPEVITIATNCYKQFDRYFLDYVSTFPVGVENPESAICEYLVENAISPKQYQFYFAIKRKNDKDDIILHPPFVKSETKNDSAPRYKKPARQLYVLFVKRILAAYAAHTPKCVQKLLRKPLSICVRVNEYLETLEK